MASVEGNLPNQIEVELRIGDYIGTAITLCGSESAQWWEDLGNLLYGRPGWSCRVADTGPGVEMLWSFGALDSSLFVISMQAAPAYHLYDSEADIEHEFDNVDELREWLDENEQVHLEYPRRLREQAADSDWALLRAVRFKVDVTFDGSSWIATFRQLPVTYSAGLTLSDAVANAREAITDAFDAPRALAPKLKVLLRLDDTASAAL